MADLIRRQDAIDCFWDEKRYLRDAIDVVKDIRQLPSIDAVERKKGEWIDKEVIEDRKDSKIQEWQQARCSVCNKWHTTPYMYYFDNFNYCPNCGADMRGMSTTSCTVKGDCKCKTNTPNT